MNEFEWMVEVPTCITLQPNTIYHFTPNIGYEDLTRYIATLNPIHGDVIKWLNGLIGDEYLDKHGVKYFTVGDDIHIQGWCNVTTIDEALDYNPDYSVVEVRDVFDYPLSRPIVPNQG
jgi:hypothetical protein